MAKLNTTPWETKAAWAFLGGLVVFLLLKGCNKPQDPIFINTRSDSTIVKDSTVYVDRDHYNTTTRIDSVRVPWKKPLTFDDSVDIWYAMEHIVFITDSVFLYDSTGSVIFRGFIEDSLYLNRISWRQFSGRIDRPTTIINNIFEPIVNKKALGAGASITTDGTGFLDLYYRDAKGNTIEGGLGTGKVIKIGYKRDLFRIK